MCVGTNYIFCKGWWVGAYISLLHFILFHQWACKYKLLETQFFFQYLKQKTIPKLDCSRSIMKGDLQTCKSKASAMEPKGPFCLRGVLLPEAVRCFQAQCYCHCAISSGFHARLSISTKQPSWDKMPLVPWMKYSEVERDNKRLWQAVSSLDYS